MCSSASFLLVGDEPIQLKNKSKNKHQLYGGQRVTLYLNEIGRRCGGGGSRIKEEGMQQLEKQKYSGLP